MESIELTEFEPESQNNQTLEEAKIFKRDETHMKQARLKDTIPHSGRIAKIAHFGHLLAGKCMLGKKTLEDILEEAQGFSNYFRATCLASQHLAIGFSMHSSCASTMQVPTQSQRTAS